jgi:hypothetical protein
MLYLLVLRLLRVVLQPHRLLLSTSTPPTMDTRKSALILINPIYGCVHFPVCVCPIWSFIFDTDQAQIYIAYMIHSLIFWKM